MEAGETGQKRGQERREKAEITELQASQPAVKIPCPVLGFPRLKLLKYAVKVNRMPLVAMLDSGAMVNVVDACTVARVGGTIVS